MPSLASSPIPLLDCPHSAWWDRLERLEPMESSEGPRGPWAFESEMVPAAEVVSEIIPKTEVQDLVSADSSSKVAIKGKDVLVASEDDGATKVLVEPVFFGVDPDAETNDDFLKEEQTVSYANLSFEEFKFQWMLRYYPEWAHPLLKRQKREREKNDQ
jgi:hypothetical protein